MDSKKEDIQEDQNDSGAWDDGETEETVSFQRKDGVEKDGYICFPVGAEPPPDDEPEDVPEEEKIDMDFGTCPDDPRFQQTNKTKWCYRMYVDYHSCRNLLGRSANQCNYFYRCYTSLCPHSWVEKWDDQREQGNFPCDPTKGCPNLNSKCEEQKPCL